MELEVEKIKIDGNPRTDFGDMDELIASVKETGILEPLLIDKDNNLIAGERRLRAAKSVGLKTVPVRIIEATKEQQEEIKLIENIQRKNLNPVEEAKSFQKYLKETGYKESILAEKLGKTESYIQRRLLLIDANEEVQKALIDKKIEIGHAVILSRLENQSKTKKYLKEIISDKISVSDMDDYLRSEECPELEKAPFEITECKNCKFNGGEQTLLLETDGIKGRCLNAKCFVKKTNEWVKSETKILKEKGITVMTPKEIEDHKNARKISEWDNDYKKIVKDLTKKSEFYAVVFDKEYSEIPKKLIYQIKKEKIETKKEDMTEEENQDVEKQLNLNRKEKLQRKIAEYKRDILIDKTRELLKPGNKLLGLVLREAIDSNPANAFKDDALKAIGLNEHDKGYMQKIINLNKERIDQGLTEISKIAVSQILDLEDLETTAEEFGFNWEKHFVMTEDFLKLHSKDQLIKLAKELKIDIKEAQKNSEIIDIILNSWMTGQVPKILA